MFPTYDRQFMKRKSCDVSALAQSLVGRCFVWEPKRAHATASVVVVSVTYNADDEWWVETADLTTGKKAWNELTRFDEATKISGAVIGDLLMQERVKAA